MIIAYEGDTVLDNDWHPDFKAALDKSGLSSLFAPEAMDRDEGGNGGVMLKDDGMETGEAIVSLTGMVIQKSFLADIFAGDLHMLGGLKYLLGQD